MQRRQFIQISLAGMAAAWAFPAFANGERRAASLRSDPWDGFHQARQRLPR